MITNAGYITHLSLSLSQPIDRGCTLQINYMRCNLINKLFAKYTFSAFFGTVKMSITAPINCFFCYAHKLFQNQYSFQLSMPITPLQHFETCTLTAQRQSVWKTSSTERIVGNFTKNEKRIALSFKVAVPTICGSAISKNWFLFNQQLSM